MAVKTKQTQVTLLEATKYNPFASEWNTYTHTTLELDGPTFVTVGGFTYNIIGLEWNEAGTSQLLVADNGQRFRPGDVKLQYSISLAS